jgi:hypothetical protein
MQFTEQCVTDDLELLIAEMARYQAHHHHCSLAAATRQMRALLARSRPRSIAPLARRMATTIEIFVVGCLGGRA